MRAASQKHTNLCNNKPKNTTMNKRTSRGGGRDKGSDGEIQPLENRTKPSEVKE